MVGRHQSRGDHCQWRYRMRWNSADDVGSCDTEPATPVLRLCPTQRASFSACTDASDASSIPVQSVSAGPQLSGWTEKQSLSGRRGLANRSRRHFVKCTTKRSGPSTRIRSDGWGKLPACPSAVIAGGNLTTQGSPPFSQVLCRDCPSMQG